MTRTFSDLTSHELMLVIVLVTGLILSAVYVFVFWSRFIDKLRRYIEKRFHVKFVSTGFFVYDGDLQQSETLKRKGPETKKFWIYLYYSILAFFSAFLPFFIWLFCLFYFWEDFKPLMDIRF